MLEQAMYVLAGFPIHIRHMSCHWYGPKVEGPQKGLELINLHSQKISNLCVVIYAACAGHNMCIGAS